MAKTITNFVCQECGYETSQWLGKCPECNTWNSLKEFRESKDKRSKINDKGLRISDVDKPKILGEIDLKETERIATGFVEMDNVLGGGIVPGSVILLAGDPGIGKSTLLLQLALNISSAFDDNMSQFQKGAKVGTQNFSVPRVKLETDKKGHDANAKNFDSSSRPKVLYISGEESVEQIKLRASRIKDALDNKNLYLLSLSDTDSINETIAQEKPSLVVIDSIQTMQSSMLEGLSGSVGQIRYATQEFIKTAKQSNIPFILVGHVTKEGMVAGPMVLSHMVDTVLFLEGEKSTSTRILRSFKNRFGPVDEVGIFLMENSGMQEATNIEELFLTKRKESVPGSVLTVIMEGTRPFLLEVQALAVYSKFPMPRRIGSGIDTKRLEVLLAVLQKQCQLHVETHDIFVNIAGGMKVKDPAVDLSVCLAVFSSIKNIPMQETVAIGEVGLLGEIRNIGSIEKRIKEAQKLGYKQIICSKNKKTIMEAIKGI